MESAVENIYSILELHELTDIPVRTIRFYIKERVVDSPIGTGGGARYTELHLLQLQLTKMLQERHHLKLEGIKQVLKGKTAEVLRLTLHEAETGNRGWDDETLKCWIAPEPEATGLEAAPAQRNFSFAKIATTPTTSAQPGHRNIFSTLRREFTPSVSESWQRIIIMDGVEVSIRSDVPSNTKELVMQLVEQLRNRQ